MIVIHPLKVCYQDTPKLASTALFAWFYELLLDAPFEWQGNAIQAIFKGPQLAPAVENVSLAGFHKPDGYFSFAITRDPVVRLISAYRNRVVHHDELSSIRHPKLWRSRALRTRPRIDYFVEHLETYRSVDQSIAHHTEPMSSHIGAALGIYDHIYDITETTQLTDDLRQHWQAQGIHRKELLPGRRQDGGPKMSLGALSRRSLDKLHGFYKRDYDLFTRYSFDAVLSAWQAETAAIDPQIRITDLKVTALAKDHPAFDRVKLIEQPSLLDETGAVSRVAGIVIPKSGPPKGTIQIEDADGEVMPGWLPSPNVHRELPDHPHSSHAKFVIEGLRVSKLCPAVITWTDGSSRLELFRLGGK